MLSQGHWTLKDWTVGCAGGQSWAGNVVLCDGGWEQCTGGPGEAGVGLGKAGRGASVSKEPRVRALQ